MMYLCQIIMLSTLNLHSAVCQLYSNKMKKNIFSLKKQWLFLHNRNEQTENKIKKTIPFTITWKRIKYLGINLTKEQNLHSENNETLLEEIKGLNTWKDILCPWLRTQSTIKTTASPTPGTWVWVKLRELVPGVLQSIGSQRGRHDWVTELNCPN